MPTDIKRRVENHSGRELAAEVVDKLQQVLDRNEHVMKIIALPNVTDIAKLDALPRGTLIVMAADSPLDPSLLPEKLLSTLTVYDLRDVSELQTGQIETAMHKLADRLGEGPSLGNVTMNHIDERLAGRDSKVWQPSLGKSGFVSLQQSGPRFDRTFSLCVFSTNEKLTSDLHAHALGMCEAAKTVEEVPSIGEFMRSTAYRVAKSMQRRNNDRLAMMVAQEAGVAISRTAEDRESIPTSAEAGYPAIARPSVISVFDHLGSAQYTVNEVNAYTRRDAVVIYNKSGAIAASEGGCAVPLDPIRGVSLFKGVDVMRNIAVNKLGSAILCGVGHDDGQVSLEKNEATYVTKCMHWDGKRGDALHSKSLRKYRDDKAAIELVVGSGHDVVHTRLEHVSFYQAGQ